MAFREWWRRVLSFGRQSEIDGAAYLRSVGFRVIASGYRTRAGEIDLVAWDGDVLVFVEVKALHSAAPPEDAVGHRKQQRVIRAARAYMSQYHLNTAPHRFDILAVTARPGQPPEFRLLRDAFAPRRGNATRFFVL
jgi:putative endonuclease